jgi:hypothetical protein
MYGFIVSGEGIEVMHRHIKSGDFMKLVRMRAFMLASWLA